MTETEALLKIAEEINSIHWSIAMIFGAWMAFNIWEKIGE